MVLGSFSRLKQVQLSRLKCKLIAVEINGHQILMKMFSFRKNLLLYHVVISLPCIFRFLYIFTNRRGTQQVFSS